MNHQAVFVFSVFALLGSLYFVVDHATWPLAGQIPAAVTLIIVSLLGASVGGALKSQDARLRALERGKNP